MLKIFSKLKTVFRKMVQCVRPYNGFLNRKIFKSFSNLQSKFYIEFWRSTVTAIDAKITDVGYGYLRIDKGNQKTYVKNYQVMVDDNVTLNIAGNKPLVLRILQERGFQIPRYLEYGLEDLGKAQDFFESIDGYAVVKPASGTGSGRGVTTHIDNKQKLKKSSYYAATFGEPLLIEEQVKGDSFRLLYINSKFIDAIRRDPPFVIGDGSSSIRVLVKEENIKRLNSNNIVSFHPLIIDMECKLKLKEQGLNINSVLEKDRKVIIKTVVNQNSCYENHIVRNEVHESIISNGQEIMEELGISLGGIDVITKDITVPLTESNGVINEINTTPGLHHHILVAEKKDILPIGELVLGFIFNHK